MSFTGTLLEELFGCSNNLLFFSHNFYLQVRYPGDDVRKNLILKKAKD